MSSYRSDHFEIRPDSGRLVEGWAYEHPRAQYPSAAPKPHPQAHPQHHPHHPHHPHQRRTKSADYTLTHGGRQVRLGPVAFWVVVGTLVVMAGWSVVTGTYSPSTTTC
jgi:hypothetical protein